MTIKCVRVLGYGSAQIRIMSDDTLRFCYSVPELDGFCEFSLLCEVGQPYQPAFARIAKEFNLELGERKELDVAPWYADTVKSVNPWPNHT